MFINLRTWEQYCASILSYGKATQKCLGENFAALQILPVFGKQKSSLTIIVWI